MQKAHSLTHSPSIPPIPSFWHCPGLPDLPPKLAPVDAVVIEDAQGRVGPGLERLLDQVPVALNPKGICVLSLAGGGEGGDGDEEGEEGEAAAAAVKGRMAALGMELLHEETQQQARGGAAALLVWKAPGVGEGKAPPGVGEGKAPGVVEG